MTAVTQKPKVTDLIPLSREVFCDDTLRQFHQVIRFDVVYDRPLRIQLLLDRRHKANKSLSKPVAYFRISEIGQLLRLGTNSFAAAVVLAFYSQNRTEPSSEEIKDAAKNLFSMIQGDVELTTEVVLRDIKLRKMAAEEGK